MENLKLTTIILVCLLVVACCYIIITKVDICKTETAKNESYALGFNHGLERWNNVVIYESKNNRVIPYWFNGTYYELSFNQICEEQNG